MAASYGIPAPGYRLPARTSPGRVKLQVRDISRSLAYYRDVIGLEPVAATDGGPASAGLAPRGGGDAIVELVERKDARPSPRRGALGLFHFAILLPDRPALGRFLSHLAELGARPGMSDHFVSEAIYLQDPDNLGIEVYADRPREMWRIEHGQLAMSTVPLDVNSVIEAGGGEHWTGAPRDTRMGHVHLHVGDIDEAARFYHSALGLDKMVWNYPGALFLSAGGYHHHLGVNTWAADASRPPDDQAQLLEWELVVPDAAAVAKTRDSLTGAGYDAELDADAVLTRDPWGTRLRVRAL